MSRVYEEVEVAAHTKMEWVDSRCDVCGRTRDEVEGEDRAITDWFMGDLNVYDGLDEYADPKPLNGLEVSVDEQFDVCGPCFRTKLLPFMMAAKNMEVS